jgi:hypothetical protein
LQIHGYLNTYWAWLAPDSDLLGFENSANYFLKLGDFKAGFGNRLQ